MKIIAMAGLAQTGKSTASNYLVNQHGFAPLTLAGTIKYLIATMLGEDVEWIEDNKTSIHPVIEEIAPGANITVRKLLQTLGTEWGRNQLHPDIWINDVLRDIPWFKEQEYPGVVITDLRFENEATAVRKAGGVICHILRPDAIELAAHPSESGIAIHGSDYIIHNELNLRYLQDMTDRMLKLYPKLTGMRR